MINTIEMQDRIRNLMYDIRTDIMKLENITSQQVAMIYDLKWQKSRATNMGAAVESKE